MSPNIVLEKTYFHNTKINWEEFYILLLYVINTIVFIFSKDFLSFAIPVLSKIRLEKVPLKCEFIICKEIKTALQYFYLYLKLLLIELPWNPLVEDLLCSRNTEPTMVFNLIFAARIFRLIWQIRYSIEVHFRLTQFCQNSSRVYWNYSVMWYLHSVRFWLTVFTFSVFLAFI